MYLSVLLWVQCACSETPPTWLAVIFFFLIDWCYLILQSFTNSLSLELYRFVRKPQQTKLPLLKYIKHQIWTKRDWLLKETKAIWRSCTEVMKIQLCSYSFTAFRCRLHYKKKNNPQKTCKLKNPIPHCSEDYLSISCCNLLGHAVIGTLKSHV